ncbi:unnamed protein product [Trifolium pratense]|uniref:Uncharacterized protein n=1 Tax=Trifolium pratense TaxID=57577 RepID=A0ACB0LH66_TRIPR|nr:unnamed protein product [Trifolium pratense]
MDFVFSESEHGEVFYNKFRMDYHIPVFGDIVKEPLLCISFILLLRWPQLQRVFPQKLWKRSIIGLSVRLKGPVCSHGTKNVYHGACRLEASSLIHT